MSEQYVPVHPAQDNAWNWYILPNELNDQFQEDLENEDMLDSGEFDDKYGQYMTGGDLNLVQLYIKK